MIVRTGTMAAPGCTRNINLGWGALCSRSLIKALLSLVVLVSVVIFVVQMRYLRQWPVSTSLPSKEWTEETPLAKTVQREANPLPIITNETGLPHPHPANALEFQPAERKESPSPVNNKIENATKEHPQFQREESDAPYCVRHVDNDTVHVVILADEKTFMGMLALANSVARNTASDVMIHFVTLPLDAIVLRRWIKGSSFNSVPHEVIELPYDRLKGKFKVRAPRPDLANPMNFARLLLTELLPCVGRVIFIDADCLVLGDIKELYDVKIQEKHVIAARSHCDAAGKGPRVVSLLNKAHPLVKKLAIPEDACMVNAGVFVADLMKWEKYNISQQLQYWMEINTREVVIKYSDGGAGTQALVNMVLYDKFTGFAQEWNAAGAGYHRYEKTPKLVHWKGPFKPWLYPRAPYFDEWMQYHVPDPEHRHVPIKVGMKGIRLQN